MKKNVVFALLLLLGITNCLAQDYRVIGTISGEQEAGEAYDVYYSSLETFYAWKYKGWRDRRETYSYDQIYEICLKKAQKQYGKDYPDLYLEDFYIDPDIDQDMPDLVYYTGEVGTGNQGKKKSRIKRIYRYSATVVVPQ